MNIRIAQGLLLILSMPYSNAADLNIEKKPTTYFSWIYDTAAHTYAKGFFHVTYNWKYYTKGPCDFTKVLDDAPEARVDIEYDIKQNKLVITSMCDGKGPFYWGDIPVQFIKDGTLTNHFEELRKAARADFPHKKFKMRKVKEEFKEEILCITYNIEFEKKHVNLPKTVSDDGAVNQYEYPTTDCMAPSQNNLFSMVKILDMRDNKAKVEGVPIVYEHCKAGVGRSATGVGAYLIHLFENANKILLDGSLCTIKFEQHVVIAAIIKYMKKKRNALNMNKNQITALKDFYHTLKPQKEDTTNTTLSLLTTSESSPKQRFALLRGAFHSLRRTVNIRNNMNIFGMLGGLFRWVSKPFWWFF